MELEQIEKVIMDNEVDGHHLWITTNKYALFLAHGKDGIDAMCLYMHYMFTSVLQKTNSIKALDSYCREGLGWGVDRMRKAKHILEELWIARYDVRRDAHGKMTGRYVVIKNGKSPMEISLCGENPLAGKPVNGFQETNAYTNNINAHTNNNPCSETSQEVGSKEPPSVKNLSDNSEQSEQRISREIPLDFDVMAELARIALKRTGDVVRPKPLPGTKKRCSVAKNSESGERKGKSVLNDTEKALWNKAREVFSAGYQAINGFKMVFDGKEVKALSKIAKTSMSVELFTKYAQVFYKKVTMHDEVFKNVTFSPSGFMYKLQQLASICGGLSEEERDKIKFGIAGKEVYDKAKLEV